MRLLRANRLAFLIVALLGLGTMPAAQALPNPKPNVVVIMTDDQTVEQMRVMTSTRALIGNAGATFENSFSSFPLCCPSRATFLTGQYAHNHGVLENEPPTGGYLRLNSRDTLPVWLRAAGYRTIHIGKYLNGYGVLSPTEVPAGWDSWHATVDPTTYRMWGYKMNDNGRVSEAYGNSERPDVPNYQTDVLARKAVYQIGDAVRRGQPFFMSLWFLAPHLEILRSRPFPPRPALRHSGAFSNEPIPRPPSFNEPDMSDKPLFMRNKPSLTGKEIADIETGYRHELASLLAVDEAVAAVVRALQGWRVLDNTYIIFTSDNGYFHGEHRSPAGKFLAYEPSIRVPLLMRGPGIAPGTRVHELVANIDLAPTITQIAAAVPPLQMDGRSLLPLLADPSRTSRRPILLESYPPVGSSAPVLRAQSSVPAFTAIPEGMEAATSRRRRQQTQTVLPYVAIRTPRYVYLEYATGEQELYDLERDPWELRSRHLDPAYARTQTALALALANLRACRGEACRAQIPPIPDPA